MENRLPVIWYEWLYEVSDLWNVKRFWKNKKFNKWLPYCQITLSKFWKSINCYVHRLVAKAFMPNLENKKTVNHKNWDKKDNRLENLEWCSLSENIKHSYSNLWRKWPQWMLWKRWILNKQSKKIIQYSIAWTILKIWDCMSDIEREHWFATANISNCCKWWYKQAYWYKRKIA